MKQRKAQSSSLFLMELMIAILFFAIASAICVQLFVKAHLLSQDTSDLNAAMNQCTSVAELLKSEDSLDTCMQAVSDYYQTQPSESNDSITSYLIYFDQNWDRTSEADSTYVMSLDLSQEGTLLYTDVSVSSSNESDVIYQLHLTNHIQRGADHE